MFSPKSLLVTGGAGFIGSNFVRFLLGKQDCFGSQSQPRNDEGGDCHGSQSGPSASARAAADKRNDDRKGQSPTGDGPRIVNLDLLTYAGSLANLENLPNQERYQFIQGDICDRELVDRILREHEVDSIIHFAAESHVDRSIHGPAAFIQTNVVGTFTLLEAARGYWMKQVDTKAQNTKNREQAKNKEQRTKKEDHEIRNTNDERRTTNESDRLQDTGCRFLHVSTDEVYGSLSESDPAFTETTPYAPNSPYSASKAGSDHLARAYFHTYGLPVITTNCSNNYGPFQYPEKLIPLIIFNALSLKPLPVYGDGQNVRDWLYVEDHCSGIWDVFQQGKLGETYNIGGKNEVKNIEVVKSMCQILDEMKPRDDGKFYEDLIEFVKDRPGHDRRYAMDTIKIERELKWAPKESFESGLKKTIHWYLDNMEWIKKVMGNEYEVWVAKNYVKR